MDDDDLAVDRFLNVDLQKIGAVFDGGGERGQGVLRSTPGGSAMSDHKNVVIYPYAIDQDEPGHARDKRAATRAARSDFTETVLVTSPRSSRKGNEVRSG